MPVIKSQVLSDLVVWPHPYFSRKTRSVAFAFCGLVAHIVWKRHVFYLFAYLPRWRTVPVVTLPSTTAIQQSQYLGFAMLLPKTKKEKLQVMEHPLISIFCS